MEMATPLTVSIATWMVEPMVRSKVKHSMTGAHAMSLLTFMKSKSARISGYTPIAVSSEAATATRKAMSRRTVNFITPGWHSLAQHDSGMATGEERLENKLYCIHP
jgi:hypothetical protein